MNERDIYWKQTKIYNPKTDQQPKIHIYGAGSIGSWTTLCLAKTGFTDITIYDYDQVEEDNIPARFYMPIEGSRKELKINALYDEVYNFTNIKIEKVNGKITKDTELDIKIHTIHILALDNIETRKIIIEKLKGYPVYIIDGRIGGTTWELYSFKGSDTEDLKEYQETLKRKMTDEECGNKTSCPINMIIAGKITAEVLKISTYKNQSKQQLGNIWEVEELGDINRMWIKSKDYDYEEGVWAITDSPEGDENDEN